MSKTLSVSAMRATWAWMLIPFTLLTVSGNACVPKQSYRLSWLQVEYGDANRIAHSCFEDSVRIVVDGKSASKNSIGGLKLTIVIHNMLSDTVRYLPRYPEPVADTLGVAVVTSVYDGGDQYVEFDEHGSVVVNAESTAKLWLIDEHGGVMVNAQSTAKLWLRVSTQGSSSATWLPVSDRNRIVYRIGSLQREGSSHCVIPALFAADSKIEEGLP
jgi:hypothetical protein